MAGGDRPLSLLTLTLTLTHQLNRKPFSACLLFSAGLGQSSEFNSNDLPTASHGTTQFNIITSQDAHTKIQQE